MEIITLYINDIKPYENNPRINDQAVDAVIKSIQQCEYVSPIVIDEDNIILAGHTRLKALKQLGYVTAECVIKTGLTEEQKRKYRLLDNKTAEIAEWDFELLSNELDGLDFEDLKLDWGLENEEQENEIIEDDPPNPEELECVCKVGDVWQLGNHRLICGDCTDESVFKALMNGNKADLILSDPPYNIDYKSKQEKISSVVRYGNKRVREGIFVDIKNDNLDDESFFNFLYDSFENINKFIREGAALYIFHSGAESVNFITTFKTFFKLSATLIWVKNHFSLSRTDYQFQHEPILYGWKEGEAHYFIDGRTQSTTIEDYNHMNINKMKTAELKEYCKELIQKLNTAPTTIIREDRDLICTDHPTMKPIKLLARLIKNSSKENQIVLDPFGGSGSTLIACEQSNRNCYMLEIEPKYCDVIIRRFENFTHKKAVRINTEK